jgi:hypothetical protein
LESTRSFVKACQEFFSAEPHGRHVAITEFKELTTQDKVELSELMLAAGIDHVQYFPRVEAE